MEGSTLASESASVAVRVIEKGSHLFVAKNYSLHKGKNGVDKEIESEEFIVGGHTWTIRFYPVGKTIGDHNSGFASLFIFLKKPTSYPVRFLYDMTVLDQSNKGKDYCGYSNFKSYPYFGIVLFRPGSSAMFGCPQFIKRKTLESSHYLKDDCLKFRVTIGVLSSRNHNLHLIKVPECSNIGADFRELLHNKEGVDVFFKVGNERFCAHKWILVARCPLFLRHLPDNCKEIEITDMEPRIFKAMLWFVYTGNLQEEDDEYSNPSILESFMGKMLAVADRYEFKGLKNICEFRISTRISGKSVPYLLHLAQLYNANELKMACVRFVAENESGLEIMDSNGYKYLKETCPLLFLELAYKEKGSINKHQERDLCSKLLSSVKGSFVTMLAPENKIDEKHKIKKKA
ncbi:hypothetical protein ABFX02_09G003700 [Erythranthe guttata]